ncbi:hypothetical protein B0J15DRAFT_577353 [Fusarium solani]|uniref:Uncharacterized protein n=1 Tax=Fusarium solani TaxID=169388 RepID=A0A9P9G1W3_FUSSL|nr:uncharacterized protein B0J15DRAFT_577353 [Fusarium solani]KAH7228636.1 hypothetical protein B0J15DRAFT_577353 [Fusarium solani]
MSAPFAPKRRDVMSSSRPGRPFAPGPIFRLLGHHGTPVDLPTHPGTVQLDRAPPGSRFLAMGRPHAASPSGSSPSPTPHSGSYSRPTTPRQPPVSSRPNPFNDAPSSPSSSSSSSSSHPRSHSPSPSLSPPSSPSSQWHRTGKYTILRFHVNPNPGLAPGHRGLNVALCFHNGYWQSLTEGGDDITIHFNDHQRVVPCAGAPYESHTLPSAPNYVIQSSDVNLWVEEDDVFDTGLVSSSHLENQPKQHKPSLIRFQRPVTSTQENVKDVASKRQPRQPINNKLILWTGYAVLCYLILAILISFSHPRQQPPVTVYEATPFHPEAIVTDVLPVYDRFHQLCLRQALFPRNSTFFNLPLDTLAIGLMFSNRDLCLPVQDIGTMWNPEQGLTMDIMERWDYEKELRKGGPVYDGVDLDELCSNVSKAVDRATTRFLRTIWYLESHATDTSRIAIEGLAVSLMIREKMDAQNATSTKPSGKPYTTGPATPPTPDPSPLLTLAILKDIADEEVGPSLHSMMDKTMEEMNEFRKLLKDAIQQIDQVLDISRNVTEHTTDTNHGTGTSEPLFWKSWWTRNNPETRRKAEKPKLLRKTKDSMGFFINVRHNLTVVASALEEVFNEQEDILHEEDKIVHWIQKLLDAASLASQADSGGIVHLQNDTRENYIAGKWHSNLWAPYRPKLEKEEFGQWCLCPDCPRAQGEKVIVRLHLPNPTEAIAAIFPTWMLILQEDVALWEMAESRRDEAEKSRPW